MIMSMSIKSKALFGFGLAALVSAAGAQPASADSELCTGPSVTGVTGLIKDGSSCAPKADSKTITALYIGYSASDIDLLKLGGSTIFTNNTTPSGTTATLTVALGGVPFVLENTNDPILGDKSYTAGVGYENYVNLSTSAPAFFPTYHFADFKVSSESDFNALFRPKVDMSAAANAVIMAHGGYGSWLFVGIEDLPWKGTDDWNDAVFAFQGVSTPEPSTWTMLLLGFAGLGYAAHRSTKRRTVAEA
jgi:hypothetical protein